MTTEDHVTIGALLRDAKALAVGVMYPGEHDPSGVPLLRVADVTSNGLNLQPSFRISQAVHEEYRRTALRGGEVLITLVGRPGVAAVVPPEMSGWNVARALGVLWLREPDDATYLKYCLACPEVQHTIEGLCNTTVQATLNLKEIRGLRLQWPGKKRRSAVADFLSALDAKIELNLRMNETLAAMAHAIFSDWFVDFGPVRRKLAGVADPVEVMGGVTTDPSHAAQLAALFPGDFEAEELPLGWHTSRVEEVLELAYGKSLPKTMRTEGPFPVYGSGGVSGTHSEALVSGPGIIVGRKGTVGSLFWEPSDFFAIDTVFYVVPRQGVSLTFLWYLLGTLGLEGMNTDAAVPGLNRNNVYRLEFSLPGSDVLAAFDGIASSLMAKIDANNTEIGTLAETRDYLLPRLMSGEVRVVHAAQEVAA